VIVRARLRFTQISAGTELTCGLLASGAAWCWGQNDDGMLGARLSADSTSVPQPVRVADGHHFTSISVGDYSACALDDDQAAWCWGRSFFGELGNGIPDQPANAPARVVGDHRFLAVSVGSNTTCALDESHLAWCWGRAFRNSIPGRTESAAFPVAISPPPDFPQPITFLSIKLHYTDACAIATELDGGDLWCWGDNSAGQVVDATSDPVFAQVGDVTPFMFGVGSDIVCYTGDDRETRSIPIDQCRGTDLSSGVIAPNTVQDYPTIVGAVALDVGRSFACAIRNGGELRCWGANFVGQLGIGANSDAVSVPVAPNGGHTWTAIELGDFHSCGISTDGIAYCWGSNIGGKLGDGTLLDRYVPTAVAGQL
jgi:alpha-tubulin suppressor-like RCC1 family protein